MRECVHAHARVEMHVCMNAEVCVYVINVCKCSKNQEGSEGASDRRVASQKSDDGEISEGSSLPAWP